MRDRLNDIVAGILLFVGLAMGIGGVLLAIAGIGSRWIVAAGAMMVVGVFLYCQLREVDDGHLDDGQ